MGNGVWLGVRDESGETIIGTIEGVVKCRGFIRKHADAGRWNKADVDAIRGTPWQPTPGRDSEEIKCEIRIPHNETPIVPPLEESDQKVGDKRAILLK